MFHMQRQRRLYEEHARFYAAEICLALNFLHEKGGGFLFALWTFCMKKERNIFLFHSIFSIRKEGYIYIYFLHWTLCMRKEGNFFSALNFLNEEENIFFLRWTLCMWKMGQCFLHDIFCKGNIYIFFWTELYGRKYIFFTLNFMYEKGRAHFFTQYFLNEKGGEFFFVCTQFSAGERKEIFFFLHWIF